MYPCSLYRKIPHRADFSREGEGEGEGEGEREGEGEGEGEGERFSNPFKRRKIYRL